MIALHYLKYAYDLSDAAVVSAWVVTPYIQLFIGMKFFQHEPPIDSSSMRRWRMRIGEAGAENLLKEMIRSGLKLKVVKPIQPRGNSVDTTVQEKSDLFPYRLASVRPSSAAPGKCSQKTKEQSETELQSKIHTSADASELVCGKKTMNQVKRIEKPYERVSVDMGYRGMTTQVTLNAMSIKVKRKNPMEWMKRKEAVEPGIGHLKQEHRMDRYRLKVRLGDRLIVILSAAGINFRKLLKRAADLLRLFLLRFFMDFLGGMVLACAK